MYNLKKKKYIAGLLIVVLLIGIVGLFSYGKIDKYKGLVKVSHAKLEASVLNTNAMTSKGTEELEYVVNYTLDPVSGLTNRNVIIKGTLNSNYASFKEINKTGVTSTLSDSGKEIEINIENVRLGEPQELKLKIQVTNAPNNESIIPEISIKEATGEYTRVTGEEIKVETNSVEGVVLDENNIPVGNIELSISKDGREIRRTYTSENGSYVFSDLESGSYIIKVEEEMYEIVSGSSITDQTTTNNIKVKEVDKFNIETHKYIEKLDLVINGKKEHYTYKDAEKVVQAVKNAKTISGQIEYKIVVRNKGEKNTAIERVVDEPGEGLEFKESNNTGWKLEDGLIKYKPIEGSVLSPKEKREIKLVLDITNTNEIKTYINKLTTKGEIKEKVVFVVDNRTVKEVSVVEGDKVERPNLEIDNLDGWYTDKNYTNKYKFTNEVYKDLILYAKTKEEQREYTVRFIDQGQVVTSETVEEGNKVNRPSDPEKEGYRFECWKKNNTCYDFNEEVNEDFDLESSYNVITYNIAYDLDGGVVNPDNRTAYTIETETFTLNNPSKMGHTFTGWTGTGLSQKTNTVTIEQGSTGNREYKANYEINSYQLEIDPKGGTYSGELSITGDYGEIVSVNNPSKTGYEFTGWTLTGSGTYNNGIYTFGEGNGKLEANYNPIEYQITYAGITEEERASLNNLTSYNVETASFTLNNPVNRLNEDNEGEVFVGWKEEEDTTPSTNVTLPDINNLGNKKYTAIWNEREADKWNIIYNLNGGTLEEANPTAYKRSELPITLNNPTKEGYEFTGWTGSNGTTPSNVTIARGTEGDLNYEANYNMVSYNIDYDYTSCSLTPEEIAALNNKTSYTIEDNNFNLNNPSKVGKTFTGWTGTDLTSNTMNVEVQTNKIKNLSYVAHCSINKYNAEFYNMNSNNEYSLVTTKEDVEYNTSISITDAPEVSLRGYTFKYWSLDKTNEYDFNTPVTSDIKLYAVYQKDIYPITYDLDGGSLGEGITNRDSYSVDTEEFTLNNPTKTGYEFTGWTGSNGDDPLKVVTLPEQELGPKNYTANYKINKYKVTYMNGDDLFLEQTNIDYNTTTTRPSTNPSKAHNIFLKWLKEDNTEFDFNTPITEDITLYASFEEVEAPTITHAPTTWVRDKVTVTIASNHNDYSYMYKVGNGDYQEYTEAFEVDENTTVYAYSVKNDITSVETSHEITNIDKINPTITLLETTNIAPISIDIHVKGIDHESGVDKFKIYLDNELLFESEEYISDLTSEKELEYKISNLEQVTTYIIKAEIIDKVGNSSYEELEVTTTPKHYVARTLEDDGTEINKYETLKEAIESDECISICNIEMLDNIEETNSVLDGQDIKLDLNGFTITGVQDKAFENNGVLQIVDHNEDEVGKIYSAGTAIINTGKLTIGENEEELFVDANEPIIEGSITGINSPGELHFYDGKIIGASTTGALKGTAPITPYSYNASVDTAGGKEIATLEVIADAEARINSVYYTKVQDAIDSSKNGSYSESSISTEILSQAQILSDYGFIYDEVTNTLKSNNQGIANTTANSYLFLSTKGEANDIILSIDATISSQSGYDIGYVTITNNKAVPSYDQTNGRYIYISGNDYDNFNIILEKGKDYYIHFGYRKDGGTNSGDDTFTINSIKLSNYSLDEKNDFTNYLVSDNAYHFKKMPDGSFVSNNDNIDRTVAHSYMKIDMTDVDEEKILYLDGKLTSADYYNTDYMYITVNDSKEMPQYNEEDGRQYLVSKNQSRQIYPIRLIPNQMNYIHICNYTYSSNNGPDYFNIYSVKLEESVVKERFENNTEIVPNGTHYFEETDVDPFTWVDVSGNGNDFTVVKPDWDKNEHALRCNDYNYALLSNSPYSTPDAETVDVEFSTTRIGNTTLYSGNTNEKIVLKLFSNAIAISNNRNIQTTFVVPSDITDGTRKRLTAIYDNGEYKLYYNGIELAKHTNTMYSTSNENTYVGSHMDSNYFVGNIYSVKTYDRAVSEDEITSTILDDGLLLYLDGERYEKYLENPVLINTNQGARNTVAESYMAIDMTDVLSYRTIYVNCEINSDRYDQGAIHVTGDTNPVNPSNGTNRYVGLSGIVGPQEYPLTLTPGRINYIHFSYRNNYGYSDVGTFKINYIKYYQDSSETIPVYLFSNQTSKKVSREIILNEEPDTVQIIRNITMNNPLEIVETRDVILDLNGHTLTSSKDDYVVDNKGSLKIIDSNYNDKQIAAQEKYDIEQAGYDIEYNEEQAINEEKYEQDLENYNEFIENYKSNLSFGFDYTGSYQEFIAPTNGTYKIEAWGAQGGTVGNSPGGKGAYTAGNISLTKGQKIYIYVGGQPKNEARQPGGYNGGGNVSTSDDGTGRSGGGATDVRLVNGDWSDSESLASRIMIAAGGGGSTCESNYWCASGGAGGALVGLIPTDMGSQAQNYYGTGGTQTFGGSSIDTGSYRPSGLSNEGSFGKGGDSASIDDCGAGGSGYYGGGGSNYASAGGGGSSYISGYTGSVAIKAADDLSPKDGCSNGTDDITCSYHYSGIKFDEPIMISGNDEMPTYIGTGLIEGKTGNGYAKITLIEGDTSDLTDEYIEEKLSGYSYNYDYTGSYQEFVAPITAKYKIEAWGGSGSIKAYGGYTSGEIELEEGEKLYIYVGNKWTSGNNKTTFNGGTGNQGGYNGGSSTDIRLVGGSWNDQTSLASRIMVAGAGGSGDGSQKNPGAGGGLVGHTGGGTSGGTQTEVGSVESTSYTSSTFGIANGGCTGGNGYYPGSGASCVQGSGGGSSFISGHKGAVAIKAADDITPKTDCETGTDNIECSYHYSGKVFTNTNMIDGEGYRWSNFKASTKSGMPTIDGSDIMFGNDSAGAVKIKIAKPELQEAVKKQAILDTDYTQDGKISSTTNNAVLNEAGAFLNFEEGIITIDKDGAYAGINNRGTLTMGDDAIINGTRTSNRGIINASTGDIIEGTGTIIMNGSSNISILNDSQVDNEIKGYNLKVTNSNSTNFHNRSTINITIDNMKTSGTGVDIYQDTNKELIVKNSTLGSTSNESYNSNETSVESNVTFDNCNINNRIYNRKNSARTILIKNSKMNSKRGNIYNYGGKVTVKDSDLVVESGSVQGNILNYSDTEINKCTITSDSTSETYGINIKNGDGNDAAVGTTIINNSTLNSNTLNARSHRGTIIFNNSTLYAAGNSIYNGGYYYGVIPATIYINNTDIHKTSDSDSNIVYNSAGTISINGGSINSKSNNSIGVYNEANNDLIIEGNFETGDNLNYGVYNKSTFTLGNNEDAVIQNYPSINATNYSGIYNTDGATFNYYDGKVVGLKDQAIDGAISDIAPLHDIYVTKGTTLETIVLKTKEELIEDGVYVAKIGSTKYPTLQLAIDAVPVNNEETEIVLLKDFETDLVVNIQKNKNVLLNYDGHTIKSYSLDSYITNNGTLTLVDSGNTVNNKSYSSYVFENNGTINYDSIKSTPIRTSNIIKNNENATFNMSGGEIYSYQTGLVYNNGSFNVSGGKIYTSRTEKYGAGGYDLIINDTSGEMNFTGGEITHVGSGSAIINRNVLNIDDIVVNLRGCTGYRVTYITYFITATENSETNVKGGTYGNLVREGIFISNAGTATLENFTSDFYGSIINSGTVTANNIHMDRLTATGGIDRSPTMYMYNSGTMDLTDSSFIGTSNDTFFKNEGNSTLTADNTKFIGYLGNIGQPIVLLSGTTNATITDSIIENSYNENNYYVQPALNIKDSASITSTNNNIKISTLYGEPYGIKNTSDQDLSFINTTVNSRNHAFLNQGSGTVSIIGGSYTSSDYVALYLNSASTTIVGEKGGVPSKLSPSFDGKTYGLYSSTDSAILNFYDGIFSGNTAIQGKVNEIEPNYEIILSTDTKEHKYLDKLPVIQNKRTGEKFFTIQDAVDDPNIQSEDTLEVLRELTIMPDVETVNIPNTKNVILDLKGYKITQNNENLIENNGTLTIKTSLDNGLIESNADKIILNKGTLNIINGKYTSTTGNLVLSTTQGSTTNISGGDIYSHNTTVINNNGTFNMTNGNIYMTRTETEGSGDSNLIINDTNGVMTIDGGNLKIIGTGACIYNKHLLTVNDVTANLLGWRGYRASNWNYFIYSTEGSTTHVNGGTYGDTNSIGAFMLNNGTAVITDVTSNLYGSVINYGTMTMNNVKMKNLTRWTGTDHSPDGFMYNAGTLNINNGEYKGSDNSHGLLYLVSDSETNLNTVNITKTGEATPIITLEGSASLNDINSTLLNDTSSYSSNGGIKLSDSSSATLIGTNITVTNNVWWYDGVNPYAINFNSSGELSLENVTTSSYYSAIWKTGSGDLTIKSGNYISTGEYGIYNNGSGLITIGKIGGGVSDNNPNIKGVTYGLYNRNTDAVINFYDGIITGNTAIDGSISDVESGYEIIQKHNENNTYSKYLDKVTLVKNTRTNEKFYTIKEAIDDVGFTNGDTLEVLRELTALPSYETTTIPSGTNVVIDMKGNRINQNNEKFFINNGTLKLTNSSDSQGIIQTYKGPIIENNGTLIVENNKLYTEAAVSKLIINNENATATTNNVDMTSLNYQLIDNSGTFTINGGNYKQTMNGGSGADSESVIINNSTGTLNITDGNFENRGNGTIGFKNYNIMNITGGTFTEKGGGSWSYGYISNCIFNDTNATLTIDGATFNNTDNGGRFLLNYGNATIDNSSISMKYILEEYTGTVTFNNTDITSGNVPQTVVIHNSSVININGGNISSIYDYFMILQDNSTLNASDVNYTSSSDGFFIAWTNSTANVTGGTYIYTGNSTNVGMFQYFGSTTGTLTNVTTNTGTVYSLYAYGNSVIDVVGGNYNSSTSTFHLNGNNTTNIKSGTIISNSENAVTVMENATLIVGEKGGVPSITSPNLYGHAYGINHVDNTSKFYFYDGSIKGETGSIYGTITDTEAGYKEKRDNVTNPETGIPYLESTLTVVGTSERVAVVNNVNFLSLQSAVNYASNNNYPNIQLYKSVVLEDNLVLPEGGSNVSIYLGGNTITPGSYTIDSNITIVEGTAPSASLSRFLASITGQEINPKNIVIFEMSDGSKLDSSVIYKLYKIMDGQEKIVKFKEHSVGDYDLGNDTDRLRTARGKIYINGIGEGTYILVGSDSKSMSFTIDYDSVSSNIRINNSARTNRTVSAIATLILQLQTGMVRNPYILIVMLLIILVLGLISYNKYKREEKYDNR